MHINILDFTVMGLKSWVILNLFLFFKKKKLLHNSFYFDNYCLSNFVRETMKLTEVSASDKLESFRASKEVLYRKVFVILTVKSVISTLPDGIDSLNKGIC